HKVTLVLPGARSNAFCRTGKPSAALPCRTRSQPWSASFSSASPLDEPLVLRLLASLFPLDGLLEPDEGLAGDERLDEGVGSGARGVGAGARSWVAEGASAGTVSGERSLSFEGAAVCSPDPRGDRKSGV